MFDNCYVWNFSDNYFALKDPCLAEFSIRFKISLRSYYNAIGFTYHIILRYFRVVRVGVIFSGHVVLNVDYFYRRFLIHCLEKWSCVYLQNQLAPLYYECGCRFFEVWSDVREFSKTLSNETF